MKPTIRLYVGLILSIYCYPVLGLTKSKASSPSVCAIAINQGSNSNTVISGLNQTKSTNNSYSSECSRITETNRPMTLLERDQHRLLLANNPTTVEILGVKITNWLEDEGRGRGAKTLSLQLKNTSRIPVASVELALIKKISGNKILPDDRLNLQPSALYKEIGSTRFGMEIDQQLLMPIGFIDEIRDTFSSGISSDFCLYDFGISLLPDTKQQERSINSPLEGFSVTKTRGVAVGKIITTIFDQEIHSQSWIHLLFAQRDSTAKVWYSSQNGFSNLNCID